MPRYPDVSLPYHQSDDIQTFCIVQPVGVQFDGILKKIIRIKCDVMMFFLLRRGECNPPLEMG